MKKAKRLLAGLLCLCMLVGMLPAGAPVMQAAAAGEDIEFNFKASPNWSFMDTDLGEYTEGVNENWRFLTHSAKTWTAVDHSKRGEPLRYTPSYGIEAVMSSTDYWYALELDIKAPGKYKAEFKSAYTGGVYGKADFYIFPAAGVADASDVDAAIKAKLVEENYIGVADYYSGGGALSAELENDIAIPEAGKYIMVVKGAGRNAASSGDYTYLTGMTLKYAGADDNEGEGGEGGEGEGGEGGEEEVDPNAPKVFEFNASPSGTLVKDITYDDTEGMWKFHSYSASTWSDVDYTYSNGNLCRNGRGIQLNMGSADKWAAFELNIAHSGMYDLTIQHQKYWGGGKNDIYLIPAEGMDSESAVTAAIAAAQPIDTIDFWSSETQTGVTDEAVSVNITKAGKYLLVMKGAAKNAGNTYNGFDYACYEIITMTRTGAPDVPAVINFNATPSGTLVKDITYDDTEGVWKFHSYSASTWSDVDYTYSNGNLCRNGRGIQLNMSSADKWAAFEVDIPNAGTYDMTVQHQKYWGGGKNDIYFIPAEGMDSESAVTAAIAAAQPVDTIDFWNSETQTGVTDEAVSVNVPEGGKYLLVMKGAAKNAGNTYNGFDYACYEIITLTRTGDPQIKAEFVYDMYISESTQPLSVVLPQITYADTNDMWKPHSYSASTWSDVDFTYSNGSLCRTGSGIQLNMSSADKWAAMEINVPVSGRYDMTIEHLKYWGGGKNDIYLIPAEGMDSESAVTAAIAAAQPVDTIDFWNSETLKNQVDEAVSVNIPEAGKYLLVMKGAAKNSGNTYNGFDYACYNKITLVRTGNPGSDVVIVYGKSATLSAPNVLDVGMRDAVTFEIELEDGKKVKSLGEDDTVEYTVAPEGVVTVDENGVINAVGAGVATITAAFNFRGKPLEATATIEVITPTRVDYSFKLRNWTTILPDYDYDLTGNWKFHSWSKTAWPNPDTQVAGNGQMTLISWGTQFALDTSKKWVAFELNVPNAGRFDVTALYTAYATGGIADLYLIPAASAESEDATIAAFTDGNLLGRIDFCSMETQQDTTKFLKTVKIPEAGKYVLVVKGTGECNNNYSTHWAFLGGISLTLNEATVSMQLGSSEIEYGKTTNATITVTKPEGGAISADSYRVSYTSDDTGVAEVSADGTVTAKGEGKTNINAVVTYNGNKYAASASISVYDNSAAKSVELTAPASVKMGIRNQTSFLLTRTSGGTTSKLGANDTVEYIVSPAGALEVTSDGVLIGRKVGTATVKVKITSGGASVESAPVTVTVAALDEMKFNFRLINWTTELPDYSYDMTGNWKFHSWSKSIWPNPSTGVSGENAMTLITSGTQLLLDSSEKWVAFELDIGSAGTYDVTATHAAYASGGNGDIYIIPMPEEVTEANIRAYLGKDNNLGRIDFCSDSSKTDVTKELKTITIPEAGKYLMVVKGTGISSGANHYSFLSELKLTISENNFAFSVQDDVIEYNKTSPSTVGLTLEDGSAADGMTAEYSSSNNDAVSISADGTVKAIGDGTSLVAVNAAYGGKTYLAMQPVKAQDSSRPLSADISLQGELFARQKAPISITVNMESGNRITALGKNDTVEYIFTPAGAATVDADNILTAVMAGEATVQAKINFRGTELTSNAFTFVIQDSSKQKSTIWTDEKREALLYNAQYDDQVRAKAASYAKRGDELIKHVDKYYDLLAGEGLPRYYFVGKSTDPKRFNCRYCGVDIAKLSGMYSWGVDPVNNPWKIQCPGCRRRFPSNDFGSYYKLGLNEYGIFDPEIAEAKHIEMFGGLENVGYLKNDLYPEMDEELGVKGWGVDNGFGYIYTNESGYVEQHSYIAYFLHWGVWYGTEGSIDNVLNALKNAYLYTGQKKYGIAGAILLDRVADLYADFDWYQWAKFRGDSYRGNICDSVWSNGCANSFADAYDAFYPLYDDPQIIDYLSEKAKIYKMNPKDSGAAIRRNAETGILEAIFEHAKLGNIAGNFGMTQEVIIRTAVAYNTIPESIEMLDWVMAAGTQVNTGGPQNISGGNILPQLISVICRDGMGTEASPSYNGSWIGGLLDAAEILRGFELYQDIDLYSNPKFIKMFSSMLPLTMGGYYSAQIGDYGAFASTGTAASNSYNIPAFVATGDIKYAQMIYLQNGRTTEGLRYDDTVKDPTRLEREVQEIIDTYGEINLDSTMQAGYGLYALRAGKKYPNSNTNRDFWIYSGTTSGHGHLDGLNLGISAYGINMAPDLGYPKDTGTEPERIQWVRATLSHNTVTVDETTQRAITDRGYPLHFDDSGKVKVMDVDRSSSYSQTDIFRRTVVMVEVDDQVSYGVDFFRVKGGNDHLYSFHSQSETLHETEGLALEPQSGITYAGKFAGKDVPYGPDPHASSGLVWSADGLTYPASYTWLDNVESDHSPEKQFAVDFNIADLRRVLKDNKNLHLRMTMVNDFDLDEVSVMNGYPVSNSSNPTADIKYVLARRKGTNLDTLFTTVFEPYKGERYLSSMETVNVTYADGSALAEGDTAKAVKVLHKEGRIDYVVYAADNTVEYRVDDLFNFKGFVGVATYYDADADGKAVGNELAYAYLNDGEIIADSTENTDAYTGEIVTFTKELTLDNSVEVSFGNYDVNLDNLVGRVIYVDNDRVQNGAYQIVGAEALENGNVLLDIGDVTLVRALVDSSNVDRGFVYNIEEGQTFRIPLSSVYDSAPTLSKEGEEYRVAAGKRLSFTVNASSDYDRNITYEAVIMPRGASFDPESRIFTWVPDNNQLGDHSVAIKAFDGVLSSTYNAIIAVHQSSGPVGGEGGSTTPTQPSTPKPSTPSGGSGSGSSGGSSGGSSSGGGSGAGSSGGSSSGSSTTPTKPSTPDVGTDTPEETKGFTDLGGYDWAKDAIDNLAEQGVVNGTSATTFAPGKNITRADFALMMVRAFKLESDSTENFADVDPNAYYAEALAIGKANGILNGVGNDKYNPTATITRQDMMTVVSRALKALGYELKAADEDTLAAFVDAATIADYASEHVAALVANELVNGKTENTIDPKAYTTRAEVAVLIERLMNTFLEK